MHAVGTCTVPRMGQKACAWCSKRGQRTDAGADTLAVHTAVQLQLLAVLLCADRGA